jgi:hypothetical protein
MGAGRAQLSAQGATTKPESHQGLDGGHFRAAAAAHPKNSR